MNIFKKQFILFFVSIIALLSVFLLVLWLTDFTSASIFISYWLLLVIAGGSSSSSMVYSTPY